MTAYDKKRVKAAVLTSEQQRGCREIAHHYGPTCQAVKAMEEMHELIDALSGGPGTNVTEEIADVYVMLYQVRYLLSIDDAAVGQWIDCKIRRQLERIRKEETHDETDME